MKMLVVYNFNLNAINICHDVKKDEYFSQFKPIYSSYSASYKQYGLLHCSKEFTYSNDFQKGKVVIVI
jgi:hypothetical protein